MDELKVIKQRTLSVPYEQYFSEMDLTKEEKEKRIEFSKEFEDIMLFIFALLLVMKDYGYINKDYIVSSLRQRYSDMALKYIDVDDYVEEYIGRFSEEIIDTTLKHEDDEWYLSNDRSILIAENEANSIFNHSEFSKAIKAGKTKKKWIDIRDKRERKSHLEVGGKVLPIREPFVVGDDLMLYPKDETYSPSPEQTVNCRCSVKYY